MEHTIQVRTCVREEIGSSKVQTCVEALSRPVSTCSASEYFVSSSCSIKSQSSCELQIFQLCVASTLAATLIIFPRPVSSPSVCVCVCVCVCV